MKKNTKIIIGVVAVVLIGGAIFGGGESEKVEKDKTAEVKKEEKKDNKYYVGDTVKFNGMDINIKSPTITKTAGIPGAEQTANGEYYIFEVTITNTSKEPKTINSDNFHLYVNKAKHDSVVVMMPQGQPQNIMFEQISPNTSITGLVVYDVAQGANTKDAYIEFDDNKFDQEQPIKIYLNK